MKKFLSSILVLAISLTSFSAVSCFASEDSTSIATTISAETSGKTEVNSDKEKKIDYLAATAFVLSFACFVYCIFTPATGISTNLG